MFFFLSKILIYFLSPFTISCCLLIVSVLIKPGKLKKRIFWVSFSMLLFFSNEFVANAVMYYWEVDPTPISSVKEYELGIVLTGATIPGLKPTDRVYFQRGADRVTHTVQLYHAGLLKKILISGGSGRLVGDEEPEADKFKKVMIMMGVSESDIFIENETRNTAESGPEVKKLLEELNIGSERCLLITSAFHMRRSLAVYQKSGLVLDSFSADFYAHPPSFYPDELFIPQVDAIIKWEKLSKEWWGMIAYKMVGYI